MKTSVQTDSVPFLDLVAAHQPLEDELIEAFRRAVRSAQFVGGPEVEGFEREFAAFCGAEHCAGVNSGTDALRFAYQALGVRPGEWFTRRQAVAMPAYGAILTDEEVRVLVDYCLELHRLGPLGTEAIEAYRRRPK